MENTLELKNLSKTYTSRKAAKKALVHLSGELDKRLAAYAGASRSFLQNQNSVRSRLGGFTFAFVPNICICVVFLDNAKRLCYGKYNLRGAPQTVRL